VPLWHEAAAAIGYCALILVMSVVVASKLFHRRTAA
jgi:hypothetical protein